ncbi:hypothetical protein V2J09_023266 [Rumex salicifolius]
MAVIPDADLEISGAGDALRGIGVVGFKDSSSDSSEMGPILGTRKNKKRMRMRVVEEIVGDGVGQEMEDGDGAAAGQDLLVALGPDVMMKILSYLDARTVALSLLVSRGWHGMASSDSLWSPMCQALWIGKAHIPSILPGVSKMETYSRAMLDGKRVRIRREDLCDHAWDFHFAKGAPEYWRDLDPYLKGTGPPMHRYFHPDGSLSADPDDLVWGGHACCYTVVTSIFHDGKIREHYVRINRWPQLFVSRRKDWGWEMSSILCAYSSIPDAYKQRRTGPLPESL